MPQREALLTQFRAVRAASVEMCSLLSAEAFRIQPSDEVSPPWWNLGHTSWFFVRNVLRPLGGTREPEDDDFDYVLNSYYASLGERVARARRGFLSRPTTADIYAYRASVDRRVEALMSAIDEPNWADLAAATTIGVHHEQQHQELFYTEIKSILAQNPPWLRRGYLPSPPALAPAASADALRFVEFAGGLLEFGHTGFDWCWDNELPRHAFHLRPFALADRLVTNGEYRAFIDDGGYRRQSLWLDNGWNAIQQHGWQAPLYWEPIDRQWWSWTLGGMRQLELNEPVCHVSFYEADAFARWSGETLDAQQGARLPSEREWESAAAQLRDELGDLLTPAAFLDMHRLHPAADSGQGRLRQMFGVAWQWTASYYEPYPGYRPFAGALVEDNGKFMNNQRVLRGGSCVTPRDHFRHTYRNFWPSPTRFQFSGIRLARDIEA